MLILLSLVILQIIRDKNIQKNKLTSKMGTKFIYLFTVYSYFASFFLVGCGNDKEDIPILNSNVTVSLNIDDVNSSSSLLCNIEIQVTETGNMELEEKGVCYSKTNELPTVSDPKETTSEGAFKSFSLEVKGLESLTSYYLRPFVKTKDKVFYGYAQQIKTLGGTAEYYPVSKDSEIPMIDGYKLAWSDEFNANGKPSKDWSYENGFMRNEELQWYQPDNANIKNGCLILEGRKEKVTNPNFIPGSSDWKTNRNVAEYTSSSINTSKSHSFKYGRFEIRAKLPVSQGAWPAIWLLGNQWEWPLSGEIDILELYLVSNRPNILANACWGSSEPWTPIWNRKNFTLSSFEGKDKNWADKFHIWRMDWDSDFIRIYLDDDLLNEIDLKTTQNQGWNGNFENPFSNDVENFGCYILLNLAIGSNAGTPDDSAFPLRYKVDYVRVYQKK